MLAFFVGRVIGFWGTTGIFGFMFSQSFYGFIVLFPKGGWGREKDIDMVHSVVVLFLLTEFFVTQVVGF